MEAGLAERKSNDLAIVGAYIGSNSTRRGQTVIRLKLLILLLAGFTLVTSFQRRIERDKKASVLLHMKYKRETKNKKVQTVLAECSGTYITPNFILTAGHCFDQPREEVWARGPYETVGYPVHLISWDKKKDLALLASPIKHPYAKLGPEPKWGDKIYNIGSPLVFEFVISEGLVAAVHQTFSEFESSYIVTTAMANPGSSGGGAFDIKGRLIGVNTMVTGIFGWDGITMAVDLPTIKIFLAESLKRCFPHGV